MKKIIWWEPQIGKKEYEYITQVFENNFPNEGKLTTEFENKLSKLLKVKHVVAVNNATSAMFLSLKALGIGKGDEVIVPDLTFIATANAVEMAGAKTVLVDVDPGTVTIDVDRVKKAISKKTKAIIPVHVSGRGADMRSLISAVKGKNIYIIEDAAEAFMSKQDDKFLGTYGITGCFSLSPAKTITTGQGGFISTNNTDLYKKIKELKDQGRPKRGTGGDDIHNSIGFNFKFTDLQAAVGLGQLTQLSKRMTHIRMVYKTYEKELRQVKKITLFPFDIKSGELPQWIDAQAENRESLLNHLEKNNIDFRRYWYPIHKQKPYKRTDAPFPASIEVSPRSFWLPSGFSLTSSNVKFICKSINDFYEKR